LADLAESSSRFACITVSEILLRYTVFCNAVHTE